MSQLKHRQLKTFFSATPVQSPGTCGLWAAFERKIHTELRATSESTIRPSLELNRFNGEPPILRSADPLVWWRENALMLPQLTDIARHFLCIPETSVPSESLFSKAGELVSQRKSCLKPRNINQILFLNKNIDV